MTTIFEAKKHLGARYRVEEGVVGVGIGRYENKDTTKI